MKVMIKSTDFETGKMIKVGMLSLDRSGIQIKVGKHKTAKNVMDIVRQRAVFDDRGEVIDRQRQPKEWLENLPASWSHSSGIIVEKV